MVKKTTAIGTPNGIAVLRVGYVPEGPRIFPSLIVEEILATPLERRGPRTVQAEKHPCHAPEGRKDG